MASLVSDISKKFAVKIISKDTIKKDNEEDKKDNNKKKIERLEREIKTL